MSRQCPLGGSSARPSTNVVVSALSRALQNWMVDSEASHHMTSDLDNLAIYSKYNGTN